MRPSLASFLLMIPPNAQIGAQVMMLANVDFNLPIVNGSRGVVVGFKSLSVFPGGMGDEDAAKAGCLLPSSWNDDKVRLLSKRTGFYRTSAACSMKAYNPGCHSRGGLRYRREGAGR